MEMKRKPFAKQFEKNANFQIKRLHDAIYRYGGSVIRYDRWLRSVLTV